MSKASSTRPTGFEPATTGLTVRYSNQLSYGPSDTIRDRVLVNPRPPIARSGGDDPRKEGYS